MASPDRGAPQSGRTPAQESAGCAHRVRRRTPFPVYLPGAGRRRVGATVGGSKRPWTLDPKHRAAVVLRYYQGFSEAETAVALGCRLGTVKSRVHNALRRLRETFVVSSSHSAIEMAAQLTSPRPSEAIDRTSWAGESNPGEEIR